MGTVMRVQHLVHVSAASPQAVTVGSVNVRHQGFFFSLETFQRHRMALIGSMGICRACINLVGFIFCIFSQITLAVEGLVANGNIIFQWELHSRCLTSFFMTPPHTVGPALVLDLGKEPPAIKFRHFGDAKLRQRARWRVTDVAEVCRDLWEL